MKEQLYANYARVLLEIGCNLQPGQTLLVTAAPQDYELVRAVTRTAYELGAKYVRADYEDGALTVLRCRHAREDTLDYYPQWLGDYLGQSAADNVCQLWLDSPDPARNAGLDAAKVNRVANSVTAGKEAFVKARADGHVSSCRACVPCREWAAAVYPQLPPDEGVERLWDDIVTVCRLDAPDPVQAWRAHKDKLREKRKLLGALDITALHFTGPGTDLEIGLVDGGAWIGGFDVNEKSGLEYVPNIPTEEIFFVPHKYRVNGTVSATLPLNYNGTIVEGLTLTVKDGHVVSHAAKKGVEALANILAYDAGSSYFGEIALVSVQSPIYRLGKIFYNTLLDENAVCHIALGNAPAGTVKGAAGLDETGRDALGINVSRLHVDFMIGSDATRVEATTRSGEHVLLMERGDWAI